MLKATEAVDRVDPERWRNTSPAERLDLLRRVRRNIDEHFGELVETDVRAKGFARGTTTLAHREGTSIQTVLVPVAANVSAAIELYESLVRKRPLEPLAVTPAGDGRVDVRVSPRGKDRLLYGDRTDVLRVKGDPRRVGPYEKPGGIVAVLGAGNFASSFEMIRALFLDSCAVVHKPHSLNAAVDEVWEKVLKPLVDVRALAFAEHSEGQALTKDPRLAKIYFTGGAPTAKAIMEATDTELVSECGGNNPCLVVPGDRPWTRSEIQHQALQIASLTKINGGAVCGRVQTLVTSRHWGQRREFLDAVTEALRDRTPADSTYYPGVDQTFAAFRTEYPKALVIEPRDLAPASFAFLGTYQRLGRCWALAMTGNDPDRAAAEARQLINTMLLDPPRACVATWHALLAEMRLSAGALDDAEAALDRAGELLDMYGQRYAEGLVLLLRARILQARGASGAAVRAAAVRARTLSAEREAHLFERRADEFLARFAE